MPSGEPPEMSRRCASWDGSVGVSEAMLERMGQGEVLREEKEEMPGLGAVKTVKRSRGVPPCSKLLDGGQASPKLVDLPILGDLYEGNMVGTLYLASFFGVRNGCYRRFLSVFLVMNWAFLSILFWGGKKDPKCYSHALVWPVSLRFAASDWVQSRQSNDSFQWTVPATLPL